MVLKIVINDDEQIVTMGHGPRKWQPSVNGNGKKS